MKRQKIRKVLRSLFLLFFSLLCLGGMFLSTGRIFRKNAFLPPRREYELELRYVTPDIPPPPPPIPAGSASLPGLLARSPLRRTPTAVPAEFSGLIETNARRYQLEPELIAAIIRRESRFNPRALAPDGGQGLMQLMPEVIAEQSCADPFDPAENIRAGCAHLAGLIESFSPELPRADRLAFALASYNGGLGHVLDARTLAPELKLDPNRWRGEVEEALLFLKYKSYYTRFRHGRCQSDRIVDYVEDILNSVHFPIEGKKS